MIQLLRRSLAVTLLLLPFSFLEVQAQQYQIPSRRTPASPRGVPTKRSAPEKTSRDIMRRIAEQTPRFTSLSAGYMHTCGIKRDRTVWCWGDNSSGQLGVVGILESTLPVRVEGVPSDFVEVTAGRMQTCARRANDVVVCWGAANAEIADTPLAALRPGENWEVEAFPTGGIAEISAGDFHTCARMDDGTVWCWGGRERGTIHPVQVFLPEIRRGERGPELIASAIGAGGTHTCVVKNDGGVYCRGSNDYGQTGSQLDETLLPSLDISAGYAHACVLREGSVWCWGSNNREQLGFETPPPDESPVPQQIQDFSGVTTLEAGAGHNCALKNDQTVWCWGNNANGQLGNGRGGVIVGVGDITSMEPVQVRFPSGPLRNAAQCTGGGNHSCALSSDGTAYCWGLNNVGQLGNGVKTEFGAFTPYPATVGIRAAPTPHFEE